MSWFVDKQARHQLLQDARIPADDDYLVRIFVISFTVHVVTFVVVVQSIFVFAMVLLYESGFEFIFLYSWQCKINLPYSMHQKGGKLQCNCKIKYCANFIGTIELPVIPMVPISILFVFPD